MRYLHTETFLLAIGLNVACKGDAHSLPLSLLPSAPLVPFHSLPPSARSVRSSKDILAISGRAILTNQNDLVALRREREPYNDSLTPLRLFPPPKVPGLVLAAGLLYNPPPPE